MLIGGLAAAAIAGGLFLADASIGNDRVTVTTGDVIIIAAPQCFIPAPARAPAEDLGIYWVYGRGN